MEEDKIALSHMSGNGTTFKCETRDLSTVVHVEHYGDISMEALASDFTEFGAWHGMNIHSTLKSFQGYDTINFEISKM